MPVTKQTYTATATWTASQLAGIFQQAFIDAGLMTAWFDSFTNTGIENRILEITYDGTKTLGKTYYWFMFTTTGVFLNSATGWNASTDQPTGSQYLDFISNATNATTNHQQLISLASATTTTVTRYTSGFNSGCTWFLIRNGTTYSTLIIPTATYGPTSNVDLSRMLFNGATLAFPLATANGAATTGMSFRSAACHLRRSYLGSTWARTNTTISNFTLSREYFRYTTEGNSTSAATNLSSNSTNPGIILLTAHANTNTNLASDYIPIFTGPTINPYMAPLPADFGLASYYASNAMTAQDTLVVSAGVEEWEMIAVANNSSTDAGRTLFLARTV